MVPVDIDFGADTRFLNKPTGTCWELAQASQSPSRNRITCCRWLVGACMRVCARVCVCESPYRSLSRNEENFRNFACTTQLQFDPLCRQLQQANIIALLTKYSAVTLITLVPIYLIFQLISLLIQLQILSKD